MPRAPTNNNVVDASNPRLPGRSVALAILAAANYKERGRALHPWTKQEQQRRRGRGRAALGRIE